MLLEEADLLINILSQPTELCYYKTKTLLWCENKQFLCCSQSIIITVIRAFELFIYIFICLGPASIPGCNHNLVVGKHQTKQHNSNNNQWQKNDCWDGDQDRRHWSGPYYLIPVFTLCQTGAKGRWIVSAETVD